MSLSAVSSRATSNLIAGFSGYVGLTTLFMFIGIMFYVLSFYQILLCGFYLVSNSFEKVF